MPVTISLGPNDDLELCLPSGVRRYVPVSEHATQLLWQILWNATAERTQEPVKFPSQATIDIWAKELMPAKRKEEEIEAAAERLAKASAKLGFSLDDFQI